MQIQVNVNNLSLIKADELNENEYNIHNIQFTFSEEYEGLSKVALFTANNSTYKVILINDSCNIPPEVLAENGCFTLGVYAFEVQGEELIERYSPSPTNLYVQTGSYISDEDIENSEPLTPTDKEQILAAIEQLEIDAQQVEANTQDIADIKEEQLTQNSNIQANANEIERVAGSIPSKTSQLTNDSGFINQTQLENAIGVETTARENADINLQGQIDAITVSSDVIDVLGTYQELENYDTQHVKANDIIKVLQDSTHNNAMSYYRWVITNNVGQWVYVGSEGPYFTKSETQQEISDSLTDYVKNTDYATTSKGGVLKTASSVATNMQSSGILQAQTKSYSDYSNAGNGMFIGKGTLENVITGKGLVSNTDYATQSVAGVIKFNGIYGTSMDAGTLRGVTRTYAQYQEANNLMLISKVTLENVITGKDLTTKAYVDGLVGDIESILEELDIGGGI